MELLEEICGCTIQYKALIGVVTEVLWLKSLLCEIRVCPFVVPILWYNNLSTIAFEANLIIHACIKHMELNMHFVREKVLPLEFLVQHIPSEEQPTDCLTKIFVYVALY